MLCRTNHLVEFGNRILPVMGSWHIYKMASIQVWRLAASSFIGPFFHRLFPGAKLSNSPRLVICTRLLSLVRLAYPKFKAELEEGLRGELRLEDKAVLQNLKDLCEYFIPWVSCGFCEQREIRLK